MARNLDNRELLAHMEAVDDYMANMLAYPGRTFGQLYHQFFRVNELAQGKLQLTEDRQIDLAEVTEPVLVVAGKSDVLAPVPAVLALENLLPNAAEVETHTAPGRPSRRPDRPLRDDHDMELPRRVPRSSRHPPGET